MIKELAVPMTLAGILAGMLFPLPPALLDFLLSGNLLLALLLLVSTLYLTDSLKLSAMPTMLLLATLYRLSLNVAATRLILGGGESGQLIHAFGSVVIGGNLVVGAVVFLVITLIQFIVIAKGSERVAEVSARFTLDALPGKQMSIDADVRAGLIDFETARKRRAELQTESRFYGALDGAMKFVKGDAIVGLLITLVNIAGGLVTGLAIEGLEIGDAVSKYTLLTVGEGMLAQIPALLNALSAGLVVTRVGRDERGLASEILTQLAQVRKARIAIALLAGALALVPGMPAVPFVVLGLSLIAGLILRRQDSDGQSDSLTPREFEPKPLALFELSIDGEITKVPAAGLAFVNGLQDLRKRVFEDTGLVLTLPNVVAAKQGKGEFSISMRGIKATSGKVESADPRAYVEAVLRTFESVVTQRLPECVDDILTRRTLDLFDKHAPELVASVVPSIVSVTQLSEVLRELLSEGISIRNFDLILQSAAELGARAQNSRLLLEAVRVGLARVIVQKYARDGAIHGVALDSLMDVSFARAEREGAGFEPSHLDAIAACVKEREGTVLLASKAARRLIRECLQLKGVEVPVLAHEELPKGQKLEVVEKVFIPEEEMDYAVERLAA